MLDSKKLRRIENILFAMGIFYIFALSMKIITLNTLWSVLAVVLSIQVFLFFAYKKVGSADSFLKRKGTSFLIALVTFSGLLLFDIFFS